MKYNFDFIFTRNNNFLNISLYTIVTFVIYDVSIRVFFLLIIKISTLNKMYHIVLATLINVLSICTYIM